jgi:Transposase, Mutator family
LSKSQVSEMAAYLDAQVEAFRNRPLDAGPYTFVWLDALTIEVREAGRTVNVHALIAVGVNADGQREVLGLDVASQEDGAGWLGFLRPLTARGLGRGTAGHLRRPPRPGRRHRRRAARRRVATVPHPLPAQSVDEGPDRRSRGWPPLRTIFDQPDAARYANSTAGSWKP